MTAYRARVTAGAVRTSEPHWSPATGNGGLPHIPDAPQATAPLTEIVTMTETRLPAKIGQMAAAAANGTCWPFAASLDGTAWTQFPSAGTCANSIGAGSVRACRDFAVATLRQWERSDRWGLSDRHDDIAVVISELVTNALRHALPATGPAALARAGWPVQIGLARPGRSLLCAVSDPSDRLPVPREPDPLDETGRGLQVVASLSDEWGYSAPSAMGKIVWASFGPAPASTRLGPLGSVRGTE
jgi:anti-sigma regulatory factor (Ser/Thr protein kinase)